MFNKFYKLLIILILILSFCGCNRKETEFDYEKDASMKKGSKAIEKVETSITEEKLKYQDVRDYSFKDTALITVTNNSGVIYEDDYFKCSDLKKALSTFSFKIKAKNDCLLKGFIMQIEFFDINHNSLGTLNTVSCDFLSAYERFILLQLPDDADSFKIKKVNCSQVLLEDTQVSINSFSDKCSEGYVKKLSANYFEEKFDKPGILFLLNSDDVIITSIRVDGNKSNFSSESFGAEKFIYLSK